MWYAQIKPSSSGAFGINLSLAIRTYSQIIGCLLLLSIYSANTHAESLGGVSFGITQGVSNASLDWNIGGGNYPNVLSELQWKKLRIYTTQISSEIWFENKWVINASLSRGKVVRGEVQDSDYALDNRRAEFSRSLSDTGGSTKNSSVSLGLRQLFIQPSSGRVVSITPKLGYQFDQQHLSMVNGRQVIDGIGNYLDPQPAIAGLDSRYKSQWRGPWLGMEYRIHGESQQLIALVRYHKMRYTGRGNWNLRSDFQHPVSFKHKADAQGVSLDIDYERRFTKNIWGRVKVSYQAFKTQKGADTTYFSNGTIGTIDLQEARFEQLGVQLGAAVRF